MGSLTGQCGLISRGRSGVQALSDDIERRAAPVTRGLLLLICAVFAVEIAAMVWARRPMNYLVISLFARHPTVAWLFSPLLHAGAVHFVSNVLLICGAGLVVEPELPATTYSAFLCTAAVVSMGGMYLSIAPFVSKQVAAYGASGIAFAVNAYAVSIDSLGRRTGTEQSIDESSVLLRLMYPIGIVVVGSVLYDVATGPYFTAGWVDGGHLAGVMVGIGFGLRTRRQAAY